MSKRVGILAVLLLFAVFFAVFFTSSAEAIGVSLTNVSSTLASVSISSASNLYAYEVNFSYSGSVSSLAFDGFLGSGTSSGSITRGSYLFVYESKLDSSQSGTTGSGALFNVTHSGNLGVCGLTAVYADGTQESVSYCTSSGTSGGTSGTSGASGGGGGSSTPAEVDYADSDEAEIDISVSELIKGVIIDLTSNETITLTNFGSKTTIIELSLPGLEEAVSVPSSITLRPGESKEIDLTFHTSQRKLLVGALVLTVGKIEVNRLPIIVNVRSENFLFDSTVSLARQYKILSPGEKLTAQFNFVEVGRQTEQVDVVANYFVQDLSGNGYLEESETFSVLGSKEYVKEFSTESLPVGKYILGVEIVYPGAFATSSTQFEVARPISSSLVLIIVVALVVVAGVIFTWIWAVRRKSVMSKKHPRRR